MCIYCGTSKYRLIYEKHYGKIPKDETGRTYDIHHIDGNHSNNDPENLKAVTLQEHYTIHHSQGDWAAALLIARNIGISPEERSNLARIQQTERVKNGTHHLLGGEIQRRLVAEGKHHLLGGEIQRTYQNSKIITEADRKRMSEHSHKVNQERLAAGTHIFSGDRNPAKIKVVCPYCLMVGGKHIMSRYHFDNCKFKDPTYTIEIKVPRQKQVRCKHCGKLTSVTNNIRWHGDNCKSKV